jgi:hypothetical protein
MMVAMFVAMMVAMFVAGLAWPWQRERVPLGWGMGLSLPRETYLSVVGEQSANGIMCSGSTVPTANGGERRMIDHDRLFKDLITEIARKAQVL